MTLEELEAEIERLRKANVPKAEIDKLRMILRLTRKTQIKRNTG